MHAKEWELESNHEETNVGYTLGLFKKFNVMKNKQGRETVTD